MAAVTILLVSDDSTDVPSVQQWLVESFNVAVLTAGELSAVAPPVADAWLVMPGAVAAVRDLLQRDPRGEALPVPAVALAPPGAALGEFHPGVFSDVLPSESLSPVLLDRSLRLALERWQVARDRRSLAAHARCILWDAEVYDIAKPELEWRFRVADQDAAQRFFPVDLSGDDSYAQAWYHTRLEEDKRSSDRYGESNIRQSRNYAQEFRCIDRYGNLRWLKEDVQVEPLGPGHWRAVGICVDITDQKRTEEQLRFQASLLGAVQEAVIATNLQGNVTFWNQAAEALYGWSEHEALGRSILELTPAQHTVEAAAEIMAELAAGQAWRGEFPVKRRDGSEFWATVADSPILDDAGKLIGIIGVSADITPRKHLEERMAALNNELERRVQERTAELSAAVADLESFSYSTSHDLRQPLRGINGFSQALLDDYADRLPEEAQEYLRRICQASRQMGELIDALLSLARIIRVDMRRDPIDLAALARGIAADLQRSQPDRHVQWLIPESLPASADERLMHVVLSNLLGNAWKFTRNTPDAVIELGFDPDEHGQPVYFVRDNGRGFDQQHAHKLFQPFERLHSSREFEGTGIGLASAARIIRRHGGAIRAEGALHRGAAFYFTLGG